MQAEVKGSIPLRSTMDTFENATPPQEQPELILAQCWECGESKICYEHIVCCTGTRFHTCLECREKISLKVDHYDRPIS